MEKPTPKNNSFGVKCIHCSKITGFRDMKWSMVHDSDESIRSAIQDAAFSAGINNQFMTVDNGRS